MRRKTKAKKCLRTVLYHGIVIFFGMIMLYPILWLVLSSFKPSNEVFRDAASLWPSNFTLRNYPKGWKGFGGTSFTVFFRNSLFVSTVTTIGQVLSSAVIAYGFARVKFKGRNFWFSILILTMLVPEQVLQVPRFLLFNSFGWVNSFKPILLPAFTGLPFFVFLMIQFIRGIPKSLDESAKIDGCGHFGIFTRIILLLSVPAVITSAVFAFYWKWDDFMGPLLYLHKPKMYTVSLALKAFSDPSSVTDWGAMFAMLTLSLIPSFLIFVFFQKYLVEGISTTGMKG